jgi:serine/threonine-protein kinase RsbW
MVRRQKEYEGNLRQLASMRAFVREVCQAESAEKELILRLELALTEAASNIIRHSFEGQAQQSITLTVEGNDEQVSVTLLHAGKPFDPESAAEPAFDGSREGGFGLYLMGKCADEVHYGQDEQGRSVIRLVQKRKPRPTGEDHEAHD